MQKLKNKKADSHRVPECLPVPGSVNWKRSGSGTFNILVNVKAPEMKNELKIIIDTREQDPLRFTYPTERGTLVTGDYSVKGLERFVAIERKSPDDLVGCLKNGQRERFEKELSRGKGLDYFCLVIEASLDDLAAGRYRSEMRPASVVQSLLAFSVRYRLPVFFCPDRKQAARVIQSLLEKYVAEILKRVKALSNHSIERRS